VAIDFDFYVGNALFSTSVIFFRHTTSTTKCYYADVNDVSAIDSGRIDDGYYFTISLFQISPTLKNVSEKGN
jgi:hypothetical protein